MKKRNRQASVILKIVRIMFICIAIIALTIFGLYKLVTYQWQDEPQNYNATNQYITKLGDTMVSAHRAGRKLFPQGTMMAFEGCVNSERFGTDFPIPSISKKDINFGTDMWRGPVWINYNYMISKGLEEFGYFALSNRIKEKTLSVINEWYNRTGTIYEFYDSENRTPPSCFNRKGAVVEPYDFRIKYQSIRDYGWSVTLSFDMLCET